VQRGDDWARTNRYTNRQTGTTTRTIQSEQGAAITRRGESGAVGVGSSGDVYAGRDGNVYRRQGDSWQKYENGGWSNTDRQPDTQNRTTTRQPTAGTTGRSPTDRSTLDQLDRDSRARIEGTTRTRDYGSYRGSTGTRGTGSFRGGGRRR